MLVDTDAAANVLCLKERKKRLRLSALIKLCFPVGYYSMGDEGCYRRYVCCHKKLRGVMSGIKERCNRLREQRLAALLPYFSTCTFQNHTDW